ncbi:TadA family conjugal transfer-associated ATPase [Rothia aerolata]|uniref:Conjugal transfer protein n=1 Tax=Rothia aerolata TaxID=1812262 RepID=A0A917IR62_9MICC|nr:TadA family conjugal transfer-associated ATPase [Rothia aerolata]GGH61185.1 conjugal transfer protein [Rothia aerolata]
MATLFKEIAARYPQQFEGLRQISGRGEKPPPVVSAGERDPVELTVRRAREQFFAPAVIDTSPASLDALVREVEEQEPLHLQEEQIQRASRLLQAELCGLGVLEPLLAIEGITDIFVNSPTDVWIEAAGQLRRTEVSFADDAAVRALAVRLITAAGARLDDAVPSADVQTESGYRVHAVLPPISRGSPLLSIRIQPSQRPGLGELRNRGMFGEEVAAVLRFLARQKKNFLISGGTGTGKTTLLNALLSSCPENERIVTIEDSAELAPAHPHVVSLQTRAANTEGRGETDLAELVRQALRMRPSRLVLGECRGAEIADMLTAMNTGHSGTGGTLHANSAAAVPARLYALGALAGMSAEALALQASTALEFVIHIERRASQRFIAEIGRLVLRRGELAVEPLCSWQKCRRRSVLEWSPAGQELLREAQR